MNRPEPDLHDPDGESMFDFLDEETADSPRERAVSTDRIERPLPIIRKPVPVTESGPLRSPSENDTLDDGEFGFLGNGVDAPPRSAGRDVDDSLYTLEDEPSGGRVRPLLFLLALTLLGMGGIVALRPYLPFSGEPLTEASLGDGTFDGGRAAGGDELADERPAAIAHSPTAGPARSLGTRFLEEVARVENLLANDRLDEAERTLATLDRTVYGYGIAEFVELETRLAALRAAGATPDPGGVPTEETERLAQRAGGVGERVAERERLDAERAAAAERIAEAERLEAERAAAAERIAEAERLEAERAAAAERIAEAERLEAERIASARSAERDRVRRERLAAEQAAREEEAARARAQAREAARLRAEGLAPGPRTATGAGDASVPVPSASETPSVAGDAATDAAAAASRARARQRAADARATTIAADRLATDRRIAEQRAEDLATARRAETEAAEERRIAALETPVPASVPALTRPATIDDDDLQVVYASLLQLRKAVENRDIAAVISLSDPPSGRVQQLLQIFANSASVETRITNVSARPAEDTITGTLRIEKLVRADGSRVSPPPGLADVALTSTREGDGWSALSW